MNTLLYIIGAIIFIINLVTGFTTGPFGGFVISVANGILLAIIPFALAKILDKQDTIIYMLASEKHEKYSKEKKTCPRCGYEYNVDFSS
ncbi:MAG: hypothetical protein PWP48_578 [Clostridiales bacterium]|jgi:uncharacterized membrane protein YdjX (TVP38/TMEM64 family)|nr:hypothetical protein [Clostridiales bacterium]MDK2991345.1 hypothetical protein [Clostridiales bacterium]